MDLSRNGLEGLPVTGTLSHLKEQLTNVFDMSSPLGADFIGSICPDGKHRRVSITQLADDDHIFSITLLNVDEDDTFEGTRLAFRTYEELSKTLRNENFSLILKEKMILLQDLNLSFNFHEGKLAGISWYHPLATHLQI